MMKTKFVAVTSMPNDKRTQTITPMWVVRISIKILTHINEHEMCQTSNGQWKPKVKLGHSFADLCVASDT